MDRIRDSSNVRVCGYCGADDYLLLCSRCKNAWYCCKDHQRAHWRDHKKLCVQIVVAGPGDRTCAGSHTTTSTAAAGQLHSPVSSFQCHPSHSTPLDLYQKSFATPTIQAEIDEADRLLFNVNEPIISNNNNNNNVLFQQSNHCFPPTVTTQTIQLPTSSPIHPSNPAAVASVPSPEYSLTNTPLQFDPQNDEFMEHDGIDLIADLTPNFCDPPVFSDTGLAASNTDSLNLQTSFGFTVGDNRPGNFQPFNFFDKQSCPVLNASGISVNDTCDLNYTGVYSSPKGAKTFEKNMIPKVGNDVSVEKKKPKSDIDKDWLESVRSRDMQPNSDMKFSSPTERRNYLLEEYLTWCMNKCGICVIDNFLGHKKGDAIFRETEALHAGGVFSAGELVTNTSSSHKIRGDKITWVNGTESNAAELGTLISSVDTLIMQCGRRLGGYHINGRTKAMVACYPGSGTEYIRHVDNPNKDGRCITCIYYLNKGWDCKKQGGLLRIFPENCDQVADIEPIFDRLLCFWSDRRNPHEVQPAYDIRYAVTLWYFDAEERAQAKTKYNATNGSATKQQLQQQHR